MAKVKVPPKLPPEALEYYAEMGRQGGKKGGPARAAKLSKRRRIEIAKQAVQARWAKVKAKKKGAPPVDAPGKSKSDS